MIIELVNSFHGSTCRVRVDEQTGTISRRSVLRARRLLCGRAGCTCGDYAGTRPYVVDENSDGTGFYRGKYPVKGRIKLVTPA